MYPIDGKYELSADIDMSDVEFNAIGGGEMPAPFLGTFNGNGYTISNLKIESSNKNTGFFAYIGTGGKVANLKLVNANITGGSSAGAMQGLPQARLKTSNMEGKVTGGTNVGGIVGTLHGGTLQNSKIDADIQGNTVGGLIGGANYNASGSVLM